MVHLRECEGTPGKTVMLMTFGGQYVTFATCCHQAGSEDALDSLLSP